MNQELSFDVPYLCPCESTLPSVSCCFRNGQFEMQRSLTVPTQPKTGQSRADCYAASLRDCDDKLTREHVISQKLLETLNSRGGLYMGGLRWLPEAPAYVPPNAVAAKVLCKRHNSALSSLDAMAARLFDAFDNPRSWKMGRQMDIFSGYDVERWLLKVLCGMLASRNVPPNFLDMDTTIPDEWVRILFGEAELAGRQGLYVCDSVVLNGPAAFAISLILDDARKATGLIFYLHGYQLMLSMEGLASDEIFEEIVFAYRPSQLRTTGGSFRKCVVLYWDAADRAPMDILHFRFEAGQPLDPSIKLAMQRPTGPPSEKRRPKG